MKELDYRESWEGVLGGGGGGGAPAVLKLGVSFQSLIMWMRTDFTYSIYRKQLN